MNMVDEIAQKKTRMKFCKACTKKVGNIDIDIDTLEREGRQVKIRKSLTYALDSSKMSA